MRGPSAALYYNLGNLLHHGRHEDGAEDLLEMEFLERDEYSEEELEIAKRVARTWTGSLMLLRPAEAAALSGLEAARHFEQAARLQPSSSDAYYNLALAPQQAHIDVPAKTIAAYAHALRIAPAEPKIWSRYITTLAWAGKAAESRSLADAAVAAGIFERFDQRPALLVRGLQPAPWVDDPERVYAPLVETLKKAHGVFLDTLDYLVSMGHMVPQSEGLQEPGQQWDVFDLGATCGADGSHVFKWVAPACNWYHRLRKVGAQATPPCPPLKVQFSTMDPGLHVRPHTGPTNAKLTLHWGLEVPKGARIRVANETRPFVERGLIAFDDSFEHEPSSSAALEAPTEAPTEAHFAVLLEKMAAYVEGEAEISIEDYRLLRAMNLAAAERYSGMAESSADLVAFAERLQTKCETMLPQLAQIDVLEAQVTELEGAVEQLDSYSKRLESKFTALQGP